MKSRFFLLSLFCFALCEGEAMACSPPPPFDIKFESGSSDLSADVLSSMAPALTALRLHGPKCASFAIHAVAADYFGGDRSAQSIEVTKARANRVKEALIKFGASRESISVLMSSRVREEGISLSPYGVGRTRCDPTSKNPKYVDGANCEPRYTQCYQQLEDGTVCNYDNVPEPNPTRYSMTP